MKFCLANWWKYVNYPNEENFVQMIRRLFWLLHFLLCSYYTFNRVQWKPSNQWWKRLIFFLKWFWPAQNLHKAHDCMIIHSRISFWVKSDGEEGNSPFLMQSFTPLLNFISAELNANSKQCIHLASHDSLGLYIYI